MKIAAVGICVAAGLVIATLALAIQPDAVFANRVEPSPVRGSGSLVTLMTPLSDNRQQLVVVDPELHVMSVYHIDSGGEIALKCVRNFHWDLQVEQFNGTSPLPREMRSQVEQR